MKRRKIFSLGEWQARELRLRDVLLLATVFVGQQLYVAKINKPVCAVFSTEQPICLQGQTAGTLAALQPATAAIWGYTAKQLSCGCVFAPSWQRNVKPEGPLAKALHAWAAVLVQAINTVLQVSKQVDGGYAEERRPPVVLYYGHDAPVPLLRYAHMHTCTVVHTAFW